MKIYKDARTNFIPICDACGNQREFCANCKRDLMDVCFKIVEADNINISEEELGYPFPCVSDGDSNYHFCSVECLNIWMEKKGHEVNK